LYETLLAPAHFEPPGLAAEVGGQLLSQQWEGQMTQDGEKAIGMAAAHA